MNVTRIGHIALHVRDLDAAVEFQRRVIGLHETERVGRTSYLTCNDRHHELVLIESGRRGYDHIGLEVDDPRELERVAQRVVAAGGQVRGDVYDGEPGIDRALKVASPSGHVFKLFTGMERTSALDDGLRPLKFEHVSCKVWNLSAEERFLSKGLGFRFSDRMGALASWWHCDDDHHGLALTRAPRAELSHYAYTWNSLGEIGEVADRLHDYRPGKFIWGPSRHGPGNNHFLYFHDEDGAMVECCSEIAKMSDGYQPGNWSMYLGVINKWGGPPPPRFVLTGYPIASASA